jgi:DNA-binding NarL/FixJ family response regulator
MGKVDGASFRIGNEVYRYLVIDTAAPELPKLTSAEREVAVLVSAGCSNGDIAQRRRTSVRTVENQLASVFKKLGIASRHELVERVARAGRS